MREDRTEEQKYQNWVNAVNICATKGWKNLYKMIFLSPKGQKYDLSAADLTKLDSIEEKGLFLIN
jgi:hypothetical protein